MLWLRGYLPAAAAVVDNEKKNYKHIPETEKRKQAKVTIQKTFSTFHRSRLFFSSRHFSYPILLALDLQHQH